MTGQVTQVLWRNNLLIPEGKLDPLQLLSSQEKN